MPDQRSETGRLDRLRGHVVRYMLVYVWMHVVLTAAIAGGGGAGGAYVPMAVAALAVVSTLE